MWANRVHDESYRYLQSFTSSLAHDLQMEAAQTSRGTALKQKHDGLSKLLARCYYKQGQWQHILKKGVWNEVSLELISPCNKV
jgi:serine/threonine-protein kinase mTOR